MRASLRESRSAFVLRLVELVSLFDPASDAVAVDGRVKGLPDLRVDLFRGVAIVEAKDSRLRWSRRFDDGLLESALAGNRPEPMFLLGFQYTTHDAMVAVATNVARDLIAIGQVLGASGDFAAREVTDARVERLIKGLAKVGRGHEGRGPERNYENLAAKNAVQLVALDAVARSGRIFEP